MSETTTRRTFLRSAAAVPALALPATALCAGIPDPMIEMLRQHRSAVAEWGAMPTEIREHIVCPMFGEGLEEFPAPTTKEGATEALRFAIELIDDIYGDEVVREIAASVLRFIDHN
jgi:hypothetical protein